MFRNRIRDGFGRALCIENVVNFSFLKISLKILVCKWKFQGAGENIGDNCGWVGWSERCLRLPLLFFIWNSGSFNESSLNCLNDEA